MPLLVVHRPPQQLTHTSCFGRFGGELSVFLSNALVTVVASHLRRGPSATVAILRICESPSGPHQNQNLSLPVNVVRFLGTDSCQSSAVWKHQPEDFHFSFFRDVGNPERVTFRSETPTGQLISTEFSKILMLLFSLARRRQMRMAMMKSLSKPAPEQRLLSARRQRQEAALRLRLSPASICDTGGCSGSEGGGAWRVRWEEPSG